MLRRQWLKNMTISGALIVLTACGGGGSDGGTAAVAGVEPATQAQENALTYMNDIRLGSGAGSLSYNTLLEKAALKHEQYLEDVYEKFHVDLGHTEDNQNYPSPYYTAPRPYQRLSTVGYKNYAEEVISYAVGNMLPNWRIEDSIDNLLTAIYHRFALLNPSFDEIGLGGIYGTDTYKAFVHMIGKSTTAYEKQKNADEMIVYPYPNQSNVFPVFYEEYPDPLPDYTMSGNPVSVTFNSALVQSVSVISFKLFKGSEEVTNVRLMDKSNDPNNEFTDYQFALFPLDVLESGMLYTVKLDYIVDGTQKHKEWQFTTR